MILAANVWHYWVSYALVGMTVLAVVGTAIGYLRKVTSLKYPKR